MESDLCDDLRNDRIDFSRHDGGAILTCRKVDLAKSCFWTGREKAEIVAHFGEIYGTGLYGAGYSNESVQILCGIKQIICLFQRIAGYFFELRDNVMKVDFRDVDGTSNRSSAKIYGIHFMRDAADTFYIPSHHRGIAVKCLTKTHRNGILQLCSSHFQNIIKFFALFCEADGKPVKFLCERL